MKGMRPEQIIEILKPEFFERLMNQIVYDKGVILKTVKKSGQKYIIDFKEEASTSQFEELEDMAESSEDRKSGIGNIKLEKMDSIIKDKDAIKEIFERKKWSS